MAVLRKSSIVTALTMVVVLLVLVTEVSSVRYIVGANQGWSPNVNYTIWAKDKHFYTEDWLFFVYDRNQNDVLEVNKTNYESCNAEHPLHNYTTGAGRDVVALNQSRHFYFISSKGACYGGMKLAVLVQNTPPPPKASPVKADAPASTYYSGQIIIPTVLAIGFIWGSLVRIW